MNDELEAIRQKKMRDLMSSIQGSDKPDWPDAPVEITDTNFESMLKKYSTLVVDCWAPWCGPCRMLAPTIEQLAKEYSGKVVFGKLNTDNNMGTSSKFGIMSIPTVLFFKDGKLVDKVIGAVPRQMIDERLTKLI